MVTIWSSILIRGLRCNASRLSDEELDECEVLDDGDPVEIADQYKTFTSALLRKADIGLVLSLISANDPLRTFDRAKPNNPEKS